MVKEYYDDVEDFSDAVKDDCDSELSLAATKLTFEAAVIQAGVVISGEADAADYRSAQKAGQELYDALDITDDKWGDDPLR